MAGLPEGFVIDQPAGLPPGFVVDPPPPKPSAVMDFIRSIPRGLVKGLTSPAMGGDPDVLAAEIDMGHSVEDIIGTQKGVQTELPAAIEKLPLPKPTGTAGRFGESVGESLGNPASYIGPGGVPGKIGYAALGGLGAEAGGELTNNSTAGRIIGSLAATLSPRALTRVISPAGVPAARKPDVDTLRAADVEPTAGDALGSPRVRRMEQMGDLPGGGGSYTRNQVESAKQYSRTLNSKIGVNEDWLTPEVSQDAATAIQARIEAGYKGSQINFDKKLGDELVSVVNGAIKKGLPKETVENLTKQVRFVTGNFITRERGPAYMPASHYRAATREGIPLDARIRDALDDAMVRSANARGTREGVGRREALKELREGERQLDTLIILRKSVADSTESGIEGVISPQKLRRNLTNPVDKEVADAVERLRENGDSLSELSKAGNMILRPLKEQKDTAAAYTIPGVVSGVAGRVVNSSPVQSFLKNQIPGQEAAGRLREVLPDSGVAAGRAVLTSEDNSKLPPGWKVQRVQ